MLAAFLKPVRREFALFLIFIALALGLGRFWALDGGVWTWFGLILTAGLFADAAKHWSALNALDVPARRWCTGAIGTALIWSALMAAISTLAATLMQRNSPYYAWYDWFLSTDGPFNHTDTNGAPYVLEGMGITATSVFWTFLITITAFLLFAIAGIAIGVSLRQRPQLVTLGVSGIAALVVLIAVSVYLSMNAYQQSTNPDVVIPITLASWQRFFLVLAMGTAPLLAGWWAIRRSLRNPWN